MRSEYLQPHLMQRIVTRPLVLEDHLIWAKFTGDPEAVKHFPSLLGDTPEEQARIWIEKQLERYEKGLYGHHALIHKESGDFLGMCGLLVQELEGKRELEVGYHIFPRYWGNGYAPEAASFFRDYASKRQLAESLVCIIDIGNTKSERIATKIGMKKEKETLFRGEPVSVFRTPL